MNHYPHHLGDYAKDTLGLTMLEHGAYRLLLDAYYASEEAPLADDVYAIAKAGTPAERKAVEKVLRRFELREGRYFHKRVEVELAAYRERSEKAAAKANKRWKKDAAGDAAASPQQSSGSHGAMLASSHKPVNPIPLASSIVAGDTSADPSPLAALAAICLRNRVNTDGNKALLYLRGMVAEGVTEQQLGDAILLARDRKPDPEIIPLAYLAPIVADLRAGRVRARPVTGEAAIAQAMASIAEKEANAPH